MRLLPPRVPPRSPPAALTRPPACCPLLCLLRLLRQMYNDSTWYGLAPDADQNVAQQLRGALEGLFYRYQVCPLL